MANTRDTQPPFPVLHTDRLLLRELVAGDADTLFAIYRDTEAMRWFGSDPMTDRLQATYLIQMFNDWRFSVTPGICWGVVARDSGRVLGSVRLYKWNRTWRNCVTGYELATHAQGHGYMAEALRVVCAFGFRDMQLHRIQAEIHGDNQASITLAERLGFRFEGVHRQQGFWGGQFHDLSCYGLLTTDFSATPGHASTR